MGRVLTKADRAEIERRIRMGEATVVERQSLRVTIYDVKLADGLWCIAWDGNRREVITVLPRDAEVLG